jgi:hypothetical protein
MGWLAWAVDSVVRDIARQRGIRGAACRMALRWMQRKDGT